MGCTSRIATVFLPPTVLRSCGECPCTSALGLFTRKYSALRSKESPLSNATVRSLRSLCNRSSVGQGLVAPSVIVSSRQLIIYGPHIWSSRRTGAHLRQRRQVRT